MQNPSQPLLRCGRVRWGLAVPSEVEGTTEPQSPSQAFSSYQTFLPARGRGEPGPHWRGSHRLWGEVLCTAVARPFVPSSFLQPQSLPIKVTGRSCLKVSRGSDDSKHRSVLRCTNRSLLPRGGARPIRSGRPCPLSLGDRAFTGTGRRRPARCDCAHGAACTLQEVKCVALSSHF